MADDPAHTPQPLAAAAEAPLDWRAAVERLQGAYAPETLRRARIVLRRFEGWCREAGHCPFPASPEAVAHGVARGFEAYAVSGVQHLLWYLRRIHAVEGLADPTDHPEVRLAFRRGARAPDARRGRSLARQAPPIDAALRERLMAVCGDDLLGVRDRALLALGYDTLCRQGELVALRIEDLARLPDGGARIRVRASKTDPFSRGDFVYLSPRGLRHVDAWLRAARLSEGPILRGVFFKTRPGVDVLHVRTVPNRLRALAARAGLASELVGRFTGHSLRVGAAQDLAIEGRTLAQIMRAGRWRSLDSVAHYVRKAPINVWAPPRDVDEDPEPE